MGKNVLEYNLMRRKVSRNPFQVEVEEKLGRNDDCWCGSGKKYKKCHCSFDDKLDDYRRKGVLVPPRRIIKNPDQIQGIRESARVNIAILDYLDEHIVEGISTQEIDNWVSSITKKHNAVAGTSLRRRSAWWISPGRVSTSACSMYSRGGRSGIWERRSTSLSCRTATV